MLGVWGCAFLFAATVGAGCKSRGILTIGRREPPPPARVRTAVARARTVARSLALSGTLTPDRQSALSPRVSGHVVEVFVERGSVVAEGEVLLRLRDVEYRASAEVAEASARQARARLGTQRDGAFDPAATADVRAVAASLRIAEDAARVARRAADLGSLSSQEAARAEREAEAARARYDTALEAARAAHYAFQSASATAAQARVALAEALVRAPFAGEVAERRAQVGEYVTPSLPVVVLMRTDPLRIELQVPQERIGYIRRGLQVEVRVDAFPDRVFPATVRYISVAAQADTRSLVVEAIVPNPDGVLRPGLFATARVITDQTDRHVVVPLDAVLQDAGTQRVFVVRGDRARERAVTVFSLGAREALLGGDVAPGERVAVSGLEQLYEGARVVPVEVR